MYLLIMLVLQGKHLIYLFSSGRLNIRSLTSIYASLAFFFDLFLIRIKPVEVNENSVHLASLMWKILDKKKTYFSFYLQEKFVHAYNINNFFFVERNLFFCDTLTRASKFLTLASKRLKGVTIYA